jgi:hypothetical protein
VTLVSLRVALPCGGFGGHREGIDVRSTTFKRFAAGAALAMVAVLPACAFPTEGIGTGPFDGITISGDAQSKCTSTQATDHLTVLCKGIEQSLIGSDVFITFPNKKFTARVQLGPGSSRAVEWTERANPSALSIPSNKGVVSGSGSADLTGGSIFGAVSPWTLGLDADDNSADALVTIRLL